MTFYKEIGNKSLVLNMNENENTPKPPTCSERVKPFLVNKLFHGKRQKKKGRRHLNLYIQDSRTSQYIPIKF